ncbi:MAG TPA: type VI secretion system baseplate subunit TssG [Paraburkholderia sp.]|jgi:type VI secretion system protein ImpH
MEAMGTDDRLPATALIDRLIAHPQGFDLFQAICLLERATPFARALGHDDGTGEAVRLSGYVSLAFEPSDVRSVRANPPARDTFAATRHDEVHRTYTVSTPVLTLAGTNGPLPMPFTELVLSRSAARDHATADLLDIFNHRFLSFLYRSRKKHAPGLNWRSPHASSLAACLDALSNLGLRGGLRGPQHAQLWMRHAGLIGAAPRSMTGLLAMLSDRLGVKVRGTQFVGTWRDVDAHDSLQLMRARTARSDPAARPSRLDGRSVLGRRIWDEAGGIRIEFFDLTRARFDALLPGTEDHELAVWLIRRYVQQDFDVQFVLHLAPQRAACGVGGRAAGRLGWTSWVAGASDAVKPAPVRIAASRRRFS